MLYLQSGSKKRYQNPAFGRILTCSKKRRRKTGQASIHARSGCAGNRRCGAKSGATAISFSSGRIPKSL
jgi:hypothetical protein